LGQTRPDTPTHTLTEHNDSVNTPNPRCRLMTHPNGAESR
jgi:hypothetical protein